MSSRTLPHSEQAEASVLGGILLRNETIRQLDGLTPEAFYNPRNEYVFTAMLQLDAAARPIDETTLQAQLAKNQTLEPVGGVAYLAKLLLLVPTVDHVQHYAEIVVETYEVRLLILAMSEAVARGYGDYGTLAEYQADALARVNHALKRSARTGPRSILQAMRGLARDLTRRFECEDGMTGVATGYPELDDHLDGLQPTDLLILAARPAMGKTALALCIARNAAELGHPVLFFSLEMSELQLSGRLLCAEASITTTELRKGELDLAQHDAIAQGVPHIGTLPMAIDETPGLTLHEVRARAQRFAAEYEDGRVGLVIVDYLQLMRGTGGHRNREQEIAEISRGLKALAKRLGWPVMALSQLNRGLESRSNKRPMLADLRESGAIEQDADQVLFLYREAVYDDNADPEHAELIIAKQRHGATGMVELRFDGRYTRFEPRRSHLRLV